MNCKRAIYTLTTLLLFAVGAINMHAQNYRSQKSRVVGGVMIKPDTTKVNQQIDSLAVDSLATDSLTRDSLSSSKISDSLATKNNVSPLAFKSEPKEPREPFFSDSMKYQRVVGMSIPLPGFGQIYNKQYWKLPIIYGVTGTGVGLLIHENKTYRPLKNEYDTYTMKTTERSPYLDDLQADLYRSRNRRNAYIGLIAASYIYSIGDAAVNYAGDVSPVRKATTLSLICPGAGQIYNKSYWKLPFIIGGLSSMYFVFDWNNRGYVRFKKAYAQMSDFEAHPENYPDGAVDEFGGRYSSSLLKGYRNSYRRNRDLSVIIATVLYAYQAIDAHVDAHLKDYDVSNDLSMRIDVDPLIDYTYFADTGNSTPVFGFNLGITF